jgi:SAM-dependent methyltransferase
VRQNATIRRLLAPFQGTFLHPQWLANRMASESRQTISAIASGLVLDIGAGSQIIEKSLLPGCRYVSLDYLLTATELYKSQPHIFGDGQCLPIKSEAIDTALLLDVLEHLPNPDSCIEEIWRVLRPGGRLVLQTPFLYPLHDEPFDYTRFTIHGLRDLAKRHRFSTDSEYVTGQPVETAGLLMNLALSKTILNWSHKKQLRTVLSPLLLIAIPFINISSWLLGKSGGSDGFMPRSYRVVWEKKQQ